MSVRGMLSIAFATVGIVPLLLFAIVFWSVLRHHLDSDVRETTQAALRAVSAQTSVQAIEEPRKLLPSLLMISDTAEGSDLRTILRAAAIPRPEFSQFAFVDPKGRVEAVYPDDRYAVGSSYVFHGQRRLADVSYSPPFMLEDGGMAIEISFSNEKRTVSALLSLAGMSSKLLFSALSPSDRVGVLDENGRYVLSSDPSRVGSRETAAEAIREKAVSFVRGDDGAYYAASAAIPGSSWRAVYLRSRKVAEAPMHSFLLRVFALGAAGIALSTLLTFLAWRSVSAPLSILLSRIELVAAGRYAEPIAGEFAVEFQEIANSFNEMAESIERRDREIQRSEERYRLLFNGNSAPALFVDETDGSIRDTNPAARAYYGYVKGEPFDLSIADLEVLPGQPILERLRRASDGPGGYVSTKIRLRSGEIRDVEFYVGSVEYEGRSYFHLIVFDVTERRLAEERTKAMLREKTQLLQEIYHRVKNNQQLVVSLLRTQAKSTGDPMAKEALQKAMDRMYAMALVHELIYQAEDFASIDIAGFIESLVSYLCRSGDMRREAVTIEAEPLRLDLERAVPFALALNELLAETRREGGASGKISISATAPRDGDRGGRREARILVKTTAEGGQPSGDVGADFSGPRDFALLHALAAQLEGTLRRSGTEGESTFAELVFPIDRIEGEQG